MVNPSHTYGVSGLQPFFCCWIKVVLLLFQTNRFCQCVSTVSVLPIFENTKSTRNPIPCREIVEFRLELSYGADWWPKRCPLIIYLMSKSSSSAPPHPGPHGDGGVYNLCKWEYIYICESSPEVCWPEDLLDGPVYKYIYIYIFISSYPVQKVDLVAY